MRVGRRAVGAEEALPFPLAGPPAREVGIDAGSAQRELPRLVVGDVPGVDVEPVERAGLLGRRAQEVRGAVDEVGIVPLEEGG